MTGRSGSRKTPTAKFLVVALTLVLLAVAAGLALHFGAGQDVRVARGPPPPAGYFGLRPLTAYASLPGDSAAAALVYLSPWEPRPGNGPYNHTMPGHLRLRRPAQADQAYAPPWNRYVLDRITGRFTGTTDEIFQWAAAKWGLPDNLLRAIAFAESGWRQANYGDFVRDRTACPAGFRRVPCPVTFGIVGTKSTSWPGIYPWNRDSTAAAVDVLGGWLRGCYEGWVWWLRQHGNSSRGVYHAGDLWGCVGAWYSGNWLDGSPGTPGTGEYYLHRVQRLYRTRPWLRPGF